MEKNQENVEQIVYNVLYLEADDRGVLAPERVSQIAEHYLQTGEVLLSDHSLGVEMAHEDLPAAAGVGPLRRALYQEFERYSPNGKKAFEDAAEVIVVKVLGREFETYLDVNGTQRFKTDTVIITLFDRGLIDLDELSRDFYNGKITTEDMLNFYAKSGYSVDGLSNLSYFSHLTFENPLWDENQTDLK